MNNSQPVLFALLIVWIVLGLLMIKGNDKCCPRNQRDYDDIDVKMVSKASVFLPPDALAKSLEGHRTCGDYYNLNVERCDDDTTGTYCLDKHEWKYNEPNTSKNLYCHNHNTLFFEGWPESDVKKAEKGKEGFDDGRLDQTELADYPTYADKLTFCGQVDPSTGETGHDACCLCGGGQLHTQTHRDMNHDEACGVCGGGDTIGCKIEEHKCGYNADVARPAFAAIGLLITIGVVCTAFNERMTNNTTNETTQEEERNLIDRRQPVIQTVVADRLQAGAKVRIKTEVRKPNSDNISFNVMLSSGQIGTIRSEEESRICIEFETSLGRAKFWFNKTEQGSVFELV